MAPVGKYLGFLLGTQARTSQWKAATKKWSTRASEIGGMHSAASISAYQYNVRAVTTLGYIAQLEHLEKSHASKERAVINRVLHTATSSMTAATPFFLREWGGPGITSCKATNMAALYRFATETCTSWPSIIEDIKDAAEDKLPWQRSLANSPWPSFWDSKPFAFNLEEAFRKFPGNPKVTKALENAAKQIRQAKNKAVVSRKNTRVPVQAIAYNHLLTALYEDDLITVISKRLGKIAPDVCVEDIDWQSLKEALGKIKGHSAMLVIKTLLNSWSTSERYHESQRLPCLFGCQTGQTGPLPPLIGDSLKHYLRCPNLWVAICSVCRSLPAIHTAERLGLIPVCLDRLCEVAIAFHTYHALKITHLNDIKDILARHDRSALSVVCVDVVKVARKVIHIHECTHDAHTQAERA